MLQPHYPQESSKILVMTIPTMTSILEDSRIVDGKKGSAARSCWGMEEKCWDARSSLLAAHCPGTSRTCDAVAARRATFRLGLPTWQQRPTYMAKETCTYALAYDPGGVGLFCLITGLFSASIYPFWSGGVGLFCLIAGLFSASVYPFWRDGGPRTPPALQSMSHHHPACSGTIYII